MQKEILRKKFMDISDVIADVVGIGRRHAEGIFERFQRLSRRRNFYLRLLLHADSSDLRFGSPRFLPRREVVRPQTRAPSFWCCEPHIFDAAAIADPRGRGLMDDIQKCPQ